MKSEGWGRLTGNPGGKWSRTGSPPALRLTLRVSPRARGRAVIEDHEAMERGFLPELNNLNVYLRIQYFYRISQILDVLDNVLEFWEDLTPNLIFYETG
jgi:hypothetical protein